ncbi:hypothetical protein A3Q56_00609 [Intoshia linei]|uniref:HAT C-terminal dimerisation domain-containing protein n=1 Tax=Intoshia linei TaxID=1819745 RepID=A0A177BBQ9_9BILA|nr:hypothetical protein A3Q56_00609 [Intoshia linei]
MKLYSIIIYYYNRYTEFVEYKSYSDQDIISIVNNDQCMAEELLDNTMESIDVNEAISGVSQILDSRRHNYVEKISRNIVCNSGNCLTRFVSLYDSIVEFFKRQGDEKLYKQIKLNRNNIYYFSFIFDCKRVLKAFKEKIIVFRRIMKDKNFDNMLDIPNSISDEDIALLLSFDSFNCSINDAHCTVVEELIELQCDKEAKYPFEKGGNFSLWGCEPSKSFYPLMHSEMSRILLCFPTSYMVESGFSSVNKILTKDENQINICQRKDIFYIDPKVSSGYNAIGGSISTCNLVSVLNDSTKIVKRDRRCFVATGTDMNNCSSNVQPVSDDYKSEIGDMTYYTISDNIDLETKDLLVLNVGTNTPVQINETVVSKETFSNDGKVEPTTGKTDENKVENSAKNKKDKTAISTVSNCKTIDTVNSTKGDYKKIRNLKNKEFLKSVVNDDFKIVKNNNRAKSSSTKQSKDHVLTVTKLLSNNHLHKRTYNVNDVASKKILKSIRDIIYIREYAIIYGIIEDSIRANSNDSSQDCKPFQDSLIIKKCLEHITLLNMSEETKHAILELPLSCQSITIRIDTLAGSVEIILIQKLKNCKHFSICLFNETNDIKDMVQVGMFVRMMNNKFDIFEEMMGLVGLTEQMLDLNVHKYGNIGVFLKIEKKLFKH